VLINEDSSDYQGSLVNVPIFGFAGFNKLDFLSCAEHRVLVGMGQGGIPIRRGPPDKPKAGSVYPAFIGRAKPKAREKGNRDEGNTVCGMGRSFGAGGTDRTPETFLDDHTSLVSGLLPTHSGWGDGAVGTGLHRLGTGAQECRTLAGGAMEGADSLVFSGGASGKDSL